MWQDKKLDFNLTMNVKQILLTGKSQGQLFKNQLFKSQLFKSQL